MSGESCASELPFCQQFPFFCLADVNNNESVLIYQRRIWHCSVFLFLDWILIFVCLLPLVLHLSIVAFKRTPSMQLPNSNFQSGELLIYLFQGNTRNINTEDQGISACFSHPGSKSRIPALHWGKTWVSSISHTLVVKETHGQLRTRDSESPPPLPQAALELPPSLFSPCGKSEAANTVF